MPDREKVIKGLEIQLDDLQKYADSDEILTLTQEQAKEIVALLKEQKAIKRTSRKGTNGFSIVWTCGACGSDLHPNNAKAKYCSNCGQAVK